MSYYAFSVAECWFNPATVGKDPRVIESSTIDVKYFKHPVVFHDIYSYDARVVSYAITHAVFFGLHCGIEVDVSKHWRQTTTCWHVDNVSVMPKYFQEIDNATYEAAIALPRAFNVSNYQPPHELVEAIAELPGLKERYGFITN